MNFFSLPACFAALLLVAPSSAPAAESGKSPAKAVFEKYQNAVIWVSGVARVSMSATGGKEGLNIPDRDEKFENLATIIGTNGLTITSLSGIEPTRELNGREVKVGGSTVRLEASAVMKEVKLILADGTEIPGEVVLKDADLDLAFIRPKPGSKELKDVTFDSVNLAHAATIGITDEAVTVSRMDEVLNRQPSVIKGQVTGITRKPREFIRVSGVVPGCPTFDNSGMVVGIGVNRSLRGKGSHNVLIPSADIAELAEQARAAKAPVANPVAKPVETKSPDKKSKE